LCVLTSKTEARNTYNRFAENGHRFCGISPRRLKISWLIIMSENLSRSASRVGTHTIIVINIVVNYIIIWSYIIVN